MATEGCPRLGEVAHDRRPASDEIGKQPGKQLFKDRGAAWQQHVNVPSLGHATTVLAIRWQAVPVGDRHLFVCVGQHPRGEQATDAGTDDHRVRTDLPHLTLPARDVGTPPGLSASHVTVVAAARALAGALSPAGRDAVFSGTTRRIYQRQG
jgi:hypothetical protein